MLKDRIVFISGASSGIGSACAEGFAACGSRLIICSRNINAIKERADKIKIRYGTNVLPLQLDVTDREASAEVIQTLPDEWKSIDVLINNAGLALGLEKFHEGDVDDWERMIDTNIKGLLYLTRNIVPGMIDRGYGHIINIGSTAGISAYPRGAVYCATKSAVKFISDGLRMDVVDQPLRVTNIQPGMTETNFSKVRFKDNINSASRVYEGMKPLSAEDVADIAVYSASVPEHVQICEVTVTPSCQATGRVIHRKTPETMKTNP